MARTTLEVGVEALTAQGACASVSALLDIVARHDRVPPWLAKLAEIHRRDSPHIPVSLGRFLEILIDPSIARRGAGVQGLIGQVGSLRKLSAGSSTPLYVFGLLFRFSQSCPRFSTARSPV